MVSFQHFCSGFLLLSFALFLIVCFADEGANKHDDSDEKITIRASNVSARILGRSGKIMVVRNEKDDNDDKDGKDSDDKDDSDGTDKDDENDSESKDDIDDKNDKDSPDDKDGSDDKDDKDNDKDDEDYDDDEDFSDDNENLLSFELDEIEEKDADDNEVDDKHSVDSFDDVKFTFGKVNKRSTLDGIRVTTVNLSTYLDNQKASLEIIVYMFHEPGSVRFGNETFAVQSGTVKFNIKIGNWNFCDDDDSPGECSEGKVGEFLDLSLKIKSKGSPKEVDEDDRRKKVCDSKDDDDDDKDKDDDDDDDDDCPIIYDVGGDSELLLNKGVMIDGDEYTTMPQGFPKFESDDNERKFVFRVPKFKRHVLIDPSVNVGKVLKEVVRKSAASWLQFNIPVIVLLLVAAIFTAQ